MDDAEMLQILDRAILAERKAIMIDRASRAERESRITVEDSTPVSALKQTLACVLLLIPVYCDKGLRSSCK